jgi:hypothetical protein
MADNNDQLLGEEINPDNGSKGSDNEPDYLEVLVGDGKKYADHANLAKGYAHLQDHNNTILEEKMALENRVKELEASNRTVNDVLAAIQGNPDLALQRGDNQHEGGEGNQGVSKEDLQALISEAFNKRDDDKSEAAQVAKIKANQLDTWNKLSEVYGDKEKAKAAVSMYIGNDNHKKELVQNLGSYDPATLVEMIKVAIPVKGEQIDFGTGDASKKNHHKELPTVEGLFTYAQAEKVRKENPKLYKSREFQARLHKSGAEHPNFWEGTSRKK